MALIIEDGTSPANANSYVSVSEARAFASARGVTLSATDSDVEILLIKACDYLETLEDRYKGSRVDQAQPLAWPRAGVFLFNGSTEIGSVIPIQLKNAQCVLAIDSITVDLLPTGDGREVIREKLDVLETEYAPKGVGVSVPIPTKAMSFLAPILTSGFRVNVLRV